MKNYLKLLNFELNRFIKIYAVLILVTVLFQLTGVYVTSKQYLNHAYEVMYEQSMTAAQYVYNWGYMSFEKVTYTPWFIGPIAICVVALLFYVFLIWYRDWYGKNAFIYRLLMLPTSRVNIYLAKASTIFLMVLGLAALQIFLIQVGQQMLTWIVPNEFLLEMSLQEISYAFYPLVYIIPNTFLGFIINYGIGFMVVFIVFTAILFERSFRLKGILLGILYSVFSILLFLAPLIFTMILEKPFLYPVEYFWLEVLLGVFVMFMSIGTSHYLLKNKVTV